MSIRSIGALGVAVVEAAIGQSLRLKRSGQAENTTDETSVATKIQTIDSSFSDERRLRKQLPYEFDCALVRVNVAGFSQLFSSYPREQLMRAVGEFFDEVTAIVARYEGFIYGFTGSEAIFYFKNENWTSCPSSAAAIGAARDIAAAAEKISVRCITNDGYKFTITAAMACGRMRFSEQGQRLSLAGEPLVDASRIPSPLGGLNINKVYLSQASASACARICETESASHADGDDTGEWREYLRHRSLASILDSSDREEWDLARGYRADDHIEQILRSLSDSSESTPIEKFNALVNAVRGRRSERLSSGVKKEYLALLQSLSLKARAKADGTRYAVFLASAVMLARDIIPAGGFDKELQNAFKSLLRSDEKRVLANVLDVFATFDPANDDVLFAHLLDHKNNRILANVLVKEAMRGLNKKIAKQLENMLESSNPYFTASGAWAIGEIAKQYTSGAPVYSGAHIHLQHLIDRVSKLINHPNEMVARQARSVTPPGRKGAGERSHLEKRAA